MRLSFDSHATRMNRDYARLISLIKSVTVLRHHNRQQDEKGRYVAEIDDYALVYDLVAKMFETSVTKVSDKMRAIIEAVATLKADGVSPVSVTRVAGSLGIQKQAVSATINTALKEKWLINNDPRKGRSFDLEVGEALPQSLGLPHPDELREDDGETPGHEELTPLSPELSDLELNLLLQGIYPESPDSDREGPERDGREPGSSRNPSRSEMF